MITTYGELWKYRGTINAIFSAKLPISVAAKLSPHQFVFYSLVDYKTRRDQAEIDLGLREEKDKDRRKELVEKFNEIVGKMGEEEVEFKAQPIPVAALEGAEFSIIEVSVMQDFGILENAR